jgi:hypothetical protein
LTEKNRVSRRFLVVLGPLETAFFDLILSPTGDSRLRIETDSS